MRQTNFTDERPEAQKYLAEITQNRLPFVLILDKLTNVGNIAMIFRIADALRIEKILFYDYDIPVPEKKLRKLSRSTEKYINYYYVDTDAVKELSKTYELVALDRTTESLNYLDYNPDYPIALIIGSERFGISDELLDLAHKAVHLPVNGINTSINAATATAVASYHIADSLIKNLPDFS